MLSADVSNYLDTRRYRGQNNSRDPLQNNWFPLCTVESTTAQVEEKKEKENGGRTINTEIVLNEAIKPEWLFWQLDEAWGLCCSGLQDLY